MTAAVQMLFVVFASYGIVTTLQAGLRRLIPGWISVLSETNWKSLSVGGGAIVFCLLRDTMAAMTHGIWNIDSFSRMESFVALMILSILILFQLPDRESHSSTSHIEQQTGVNMGTG